MVNHAGSSLRRCWQLRTAAGSSDHVLFSVENAGFWFDAFWASYLGTMEGLRVVRYSKLLFHSFTPVVVNSRRKSCSAFLSFQKLTEGCCGVLWVAVVLLWSCCGMLWGASGCCRMLWDAAGCCGMLQAAAPSCPAASLAAPPAQARAQQRSSGSQACSEPQPPPAALGKAVVCSLWDVTLRDAPGEGEDRALPQRSG